MDQGTSGEDEKKVEVENVEVDDKKDEVDDKNVEIDDKNVEIDDKNEEIDNKNVEVKIEQDETEGESGELKINPLLAHVSLTAFFVPINLNLVLSGTCRSICKKMCMFYPL